MAMIQDLPSVSRIRRSTSLSWHFAGIVERKTADREDYDNIKTFHRRLTFEICGKLGADDSCTQGMSANGFG